jgi:tripartite motif-containing protein 71
MHPTSRRVMALAALATIAAGCGAPAAGSPTAPTSAPASSAPTVRPTATRTFTNPPDSELTLVWQTRGGIGTEMVDPIHLALGADGNIYLGSATPSGLIRVFDPDGTLVTAWGSNGADDGQFSFLLGIGADAFGFVYAADFERNRINKFDSHGSFVLQWATELPIGPAGVAVDAQGNVYVVNHRAHVHQLQKFDGDGQLLAAWGTNGSGEGQIGAGTRSGPEDLAIDLQGNVYVADRVNNRILKFDSNGVYLRTIGRPGANGRGELQGPGDITVDRRGNIYVVDATFLQKFDATGAFVAQWSTLDGPFEKAGEVMADAEGNLYVNTDQALEKFSPL